ncbi:hypothetical protein [Bradyrhizobium sp.]|jgi:hypothetical protein|uniref:hypothetical protein n=1 Tax=Bradyrhizobium sp. TaxID=376 RepID=UPI003BB13025
MMDFAIPTAADFYKAVRSLKGLDPRHQMLALYMAQFWSNERLMEAEQAGDLPGQPGMLKPEKTVFQ